MGSYGNAAGFYHLLYAGQKDYRAEAELLTSLIRGARPSEVHELTLFPRAQMERAFTEAGLVVERQPEALRTRRIYVGTLPEEE